MANKLLDLYHRAFKAYKGELAYGDRENDLRRELCRTAVSRERLDAYRFTCRVLTDWIEQIEQYLPFVEKAVLENRQFILQQGETQLIEKAKRVSKASVEHLSRHSELITHLPKPGEELIPDKIYVVENDSNFAVYENRFLYTLLCDLADFIDTKYTNILESLNKYNAELTLEKKAELGKRTVEFTLCMKEEQKGALDGDCDPETRDAVKRITEVRRVVGTLLQTSLMKDVSHAPRVKPPITRTNVLKMDQNFRAAVALYDFLCAYSGDGYVLHKDVQELDGFSGTMQADFCELATTSSYLARRYSGMEAELEARYNKENERRMEEEDRQYREKLLAIKQKLATGETTIEEYVHALEERNAHLEEDRNTLRQLRGELLTCENEILALTREREGLEEAAEKLRAEIVEQKRAAAEMEAAYKTELREQKERFEAEIAALEQKYEALLEQKRAISAQLHALRHEHGVLDEDLSSREMLSELEHERRAFDKMFASQWKTAKRNIRRRAFGLDKNTTGGGDGQ